MITLFMILAALVAGSAVFVAGACLGVIGTDRIYASAAKNRIAIARRGRLYHVFDVTATDGPEGVGRQRKSAKERAETRWTFKAPVTPGGKS